MNVTRSRILALLIVVGLVLPTIPVAGHSCLGDSCLSDMKQASCTDDGNEMDSCCKSDAGQTEQESEDSGDDCCSSGGCDCMCCGAAVVAPAVVRSPTQVTIAPRSIPVAIRRSMLSPQDAVGALLHPPQS